MEPIVLYDILTTDPKRKAVSPNTWKTRFTLNYKGLPYKTEWVEFPDIEAVSKDRGAAPTSIFPDGTPHYTLPMIHDPNANTVVADSVQIAKYLDKAYPMTPIVVPKETAAFQAMIVDTVTMGVGAPLAMNVPFDRLALSERSIAHITSSLKTRYGKVENLGGETQWKKAQETLGRLKTWLYANGPGKDTLLMGDKICFADFQLASSLLSFKILVGEESEGWKRVCTWDGGKWKRFLQQFEPYMQVEN